MNKKDIDLTKKPISSLIKKIAIPAAIGFFFNTMYNVVDSYFAGTISTDALAALSISFPVFFIIIAFGSGISTGATALIANAIGENQIKKAQKLVMQSITYSIILSILMGVIMVMIAPFLFKLLGATDNYLALSLTYINTIAFGAIFFFLTFIFNSILQAQGDTKPFRNFLIVGFFLNIILDPLFIFGIGNIPGMGFFGVAFATILIEFLGTIYLFIKVVKSDLVSKECINCIKPDLRVYKEISIQGFPAALNMMTVALGAFIITYFISIFGKEAVAAYGVALRIEQIVLLPAIGLNMAVLSIVGQNNGAKKYDRVRETIITSLKYGVIVVGFGASLMYIFANYLMNFFSNDSIVISTGLVYLRIAAFISIGYVILFMVISALQGMKKPLFALYIGLFRQLIAPVILFYSFINIFHLGIRSIWWAIFLMVWTSVIITLIYLRIVMRKLEIIN